MSDKITSLLKSRRFWVAVAGIVSVTASQVFDISEEEVNNIVMILVSWVISDSLRKTA